MNLDGFQAALPQVLAAPKDKAPIEQLCLRPEIAARNFVDEMELTQAFGVPGERWNFAPWLTLPDGRADPRIQVSILSKRVLDLVYTDPENMVHPGDSFIADMDFSYENLPDGTLLNIGSAVLRVSDKFNTGCQKWQDRYGQDALRWIVLPQNRKYRLRGILCEVIKDGRVKTGDEIHKA